MAKTGEMDKDDELDLYGEMDATPSVVKAAHPEQVIETEEPEEDSDDDVDVVLETAEHDEGESEDPSIEAPPLRMSLAAGAASVETAQQKSILELELEDFEEHPWRTPGADLTDYFNYGFTEDTWRAYCGRQAQMRVQIANLTKIKVYEGQSQSKTSQSDLPPELQAVQKNWSERLGEESRLGGGRGGAEAPHPSVSGYRSGFSEGAAASAQDIAPGMPVYAPDGSRYGGDDRGRDRGRDSSRDRFDRDRSRHDRSSRDADRDRDYRSRYSRDGGRDDYRDHDRDRDRDWDREERHRKRPRSGGSPSEFSVPVQR